MDGKQTIVHVVMRADGWFLSGRVQPAGVAAWGTLRWAQRFASAAHAEAAAEQVGGIAMPHAEARPAPAEAEDTDDRKGGKR